MNKIFTLKCPKCRLRAKAILNEPFHNFIVYTCPKCQSNVVYFKNKVDIIPDRLLKKLISKRKLTFCGDINFSCTENQSDKKPTTNKKPITEEDIIDLKILLETEDDIGRLISKL